jgi:hypothetical protein
VPIEQSIGPAVEAAELVRRRLARAIDGGQPRSKAAAELRNDLLGGRARPVSKAGWEAELGSLHAAILHSKKAPAAVKAMLPKIEAAKKQLEASVAGKSGRAAGPTWNDATLDSVAALQLALSDLLSWAAVHASERRLATLTKLILPRRQEDKPAEEEQKPGDQKPGDQKTAASGDAAATKPADPGPAPADDEKPEE